MRWVSEEDWKQLRERGVRDEIGNPQNCLWDLIFVTVNFQLDEKTETIREDLKIGK